MRVLLANVEEVFREAAARWTLVAYFLLSSLFILIFALAVNLDIVDGALAGAKLFGKTVGMDGNTVDIDTVVLGFEAGFSGFLYIVGTFLAIFATAHLVPRLQEKGTVDLYLSRPIGRTHLLLSRYVAGAVLSAVNLFYLIGSMWLIIIWKTGVVHPRFLLSGVLIFFAILTILGLAFLVGVVTSSTAVSIMTSYAVFFFSLILANHDRIEAAIATEWRAKLVHALYVFFPKMAELGRAVVGVVGGEKATQVIGDGLSLFTLGTTAAFGFGCMTLAVIAFQRKEF